jgi:hypothetical protein
MYRKNDTEVCAAQIDIGIHFVILLCIYRSSGNFGEFAVQLDPILKYLHKPKVELLICSGFNVTLLTDSSSAQKFNMKYCKLLVQTS